MEVIVKEIKEIMTRQEYLCIRVLEDFLQTEKCCRCELKMKKQLGEEFLMKGWERVFCVGEAHVKPLVPQNALNISKSNS